MNEESDFETDPVCSPVMLRFEATFHPAPGFAYLKDAAAGEAVPAEIEPLCWPPASNPAYALRKLVMRPGMLCGGLPPTTLRELLMFMKGMFYGVIPIGHSSPEEGEFETYVQARFGKPRMHWNTILLDAFSDLPYDEAHEAVAQVVGDWIASRAPRGEG
jgi:hypothetical protein